MGICKKTGSKCPINTFNNNTNIGNPSCIPCPTSKPTTNFTTGHKSINGCIRVKPLKCEPGYGITGDGITTPKKCTKCVANTYSGGGIDVNCTLCPANKQYTIINHPQHSIHSCTSVKDAITCKAGEGFIEASEGVTNVRLIQTNTSSTIISKPLKYNFSFIDLLFTFVTAILISIGNSL